jgi:anti-sigma regulatory factor (Ser/Thr protein kinase)
LPSALIGTALVNDVHWQLPPLSRSVPQARRDVAATLEQWGLPGLVETAVLLVSEVVTNAVLHARTDLTLTMTRAGSGVRIEVSDSSTLPPAMRWHSDNATTGRGLRMLDLLADSWSAEPTATGKTVWFTVSGDRDPWASAAVSAEGGA